jgi:hypothetical protein
MSTYRLHVHFFMRVIQHFTNVITAHSLFWILVDLLLGLSCATA